MNMHAHPTRQARVLLVEDNNGDIVLTRRMVQEAQIADNITATTTGEAALTLLERACCASEPLLPDLILLDINLPQMSGQEFLTTIHDDARFRHIPVVILSSLQADCLAIRSSREEADGYIAKPANMDGFGNAARQLEDFWFARVVIAEANHEARTE